MFQPYAVNPGIGIVCGDREVGRWLEQWLASIRLVPPVPLTIAVEVAGALPVGERDPREPFCQPMLEIRSGPPQGDVRIEWLAAPARAAIASGSRTAEVHVTPEALADRDLVERSFFTTVLIFLLRRAGWHHVHGATACDPVGRGWLFAGDSQSGKSTTAALLASRGWAVGTDDVAFLVRNGGSVEVVAQRATIALRPEGYALLGLAGGASARGGQKTAFYPEELGGAWVERVVPQILVLPRVGGAGATRAEPLRPREALAEMVRWSGWVLLEPALAQEHLDLLNALARQVRSYRLTLGKDLFEHPDLLMEMIL
jgi:hypothetical protein